MLPGSRSLVACLQLQYFGYMATDGLNIGSCTHIQGCYNAFLGGNATFAKINPATNDMKIRKVC
jgi:hypothetical protein